MRKTGETLSSLSKVMTVFPQILINIDITEKPPIAEIKPLQKAIMEAEAELADKGRVLVRYSGTQPMCRVMVEGPTSKQTNEIAERLAKIIRECIG
jgi:phosphoglucosamine mutase